MTSVEQILINFAIEFWLIECNILKVIDLTYYELLMLVDEIGGKEFIQELCLNLENSL